MAIRILTDTTCDIALSRQQELGIKILPIRVIFGDKEYIEGVDMTKQEFFQKLAACEKLPGTAQITPSEFCDYFQEYLEAGDEIVCMLISSELSGTHNNVHIAKNMLIEQGAGGERIHIVDTKAVTFSLGLLVLEAVKLRATGMPAAALCAELNEIRKKIRLWAVVDTLKFLKMGGRLSGAAAVVGTLLNIKPVITVRDGQVHSLTKGKGYRKAMQLLLEIMEKHPIDYGRNITFGASDSPEMLEAAIRDITAVYPEIKQYAALEIGSVVGTHIGPRCAGIAYFEK